MAKEKSATRKILGVTLVVLICYLSLAWVGFIPDEFNIIQSISANDGGTLILTDGDLDISGIPDEVNLTFDPSQTFEIVMDCQDSYVSKLKVELDLSGMENADAYLESDDTYWLISSNGDFATYTGGVLIDGNVLDTLKLTLEKKSGIVGGRLEVEIDSEVGNVDPSSFNVYLV